jgi:adenylate kinase
MAPIIIIVGPPNGGKGTLCDKVVAKFGLVHLSGGDILRDHIKRGTELGSEAAKYMNRGELVPDSLMIGLFLDRLAADDVKSRGGLLDGFPRTYAQAVALTDGGVRVDAMIVLDARDEVLLERSLGRRLHPPTGQIYHLKFKPPPENILNELVIRPDDTKESQTHRLDIYKKSLNQLLSHFEEVTIKISAEQPPDRVFMDFEKGCHHILSSPNVRRRLQGAKL